MAHGRVRSDKASALSNDPDVFGKTKRRVTRERERARAHRWVQATRHLQQGVQQGVPREDGRLWHSIAKYKQAIVQVLLHAVGVGSFLRGMWLLVYQPELTVFDLLNGSTH